MAWRIGIDIGGTFTDVAVVDDASGHVGVAKVPTTPGDLTEGVLGALDVAMQRYRLPASQVALFSHATTVVTNPILQATGAPAPRRLTHVPRSRPLPPLFLMGSNGGNLEAAEAIAMPAIAVESGPAAGVVAAALVARQTGRLELLSFDMGGTTAKASLIRGGQYETTPHYEVGGGSSMSRWMNGTGHPIRVPVIDLAEVSAGGGSIASVDRAGALRVRPQSAGADPGPVCYARGGTEPTVTDCNLLLGYLDKTSLLDGELPIDHAAAAAAVRERLAAPLGLDIRTAAAAVVDVVNHAMAEVLKIVSIQRGHDPRHFALAAFGGAGPLHAVALASELGISEVICPPIPGAFSALGLIGTDLRRDYVQTLFTLADATDPAVLEAAFAALERKGSAMLDRAGIAPQQRCYERCVDARYPRQ